MVNQGLEQVIEGKKNELIELSNKMNSIMGKYKALKTVANKLEESEIDFSETFVHEFNSHFETVEAEVNEIKKSIKTVNKQIETLESMK